MPIRDCCLRQVEDDEGSLFEAVEPSDCVTANGKESEAASSALVAEG